MVVSDPHLRQTSATLDKGKTITVMHKSVKGDKCSVDFFPPDG